MRLGRLPPDPYRVASAPSLGAHRFAAAAPARAVVDRSAVDFTPQAYGNLTLPDCTAAGLANVVGMIGALNGYTPFIAPDMPIRFYAACIGKPDATDAELELTDGAMMLDVLTRQAQSGFDVGQQAPEVGLFGTLPRDAVPHAIDSLGHAYLGVTLFERDMEMAAIWDVQEGRDDGVAVGGHCLVGWDYIGLSDDETVRLATWGQWQPATWAWLRARMDEQYAMVFRQLANPGVDVATLEADLAIFSGE